MILIATLGGVATLLMWGAADYLVGKSGQRIDAYLTNLIAQSVGIFLPLPFIFLIGIASAPTSAYLTLAIIGAIFTVAFVFFIKALAQGPFGVAAPLANSYAFLTLLVGYFFLGFEITLSALFALVVILLGVLVLSIDRTTFSISGFRGSTAYYAGMTMLLWGAAFSLIDTVVEKFAWFELLFLMNVFIFLFSFAYYCVHHKTLPSVRALFSKQTGYAWLGGIFVTVGSMLFFATVEYAGGVAIPVVIASAAPLVTSLLARYRDNEQLSWPKRLGALVVIAGIMLLNTL